MKNWINWINWINKNYKVICVFLIFVIAVVVIPILINEAYKCNNGYGTVWGGSDVLSYYGTMISAIGTVFLGYIAWKQNERLLSLEERSYITENVGVALLKEIKITGVKTLVCNLDEHMEQIVITTDAANCNWNEYGSISIACKLKPMDGKRHIPLIHVKTVSVIGSKTGNNMDSYIEAGENDNTYSSVAISEKYDQFEITIIMSKDEKEKFVDSINDTQSSLLIEMELSLLTEKYVETSLKCRAKLYNPEYDEKEKIYNRFKSNNDDDLMCFWSGANIRKYNEIKVRTASKEKRNNG